MRFDPKLVRAILLEVERLDDGKGGDLKVRVPGVDYQVINYHCRLLREAGYIDVCEIPDTDPDEGLHYVPGRLRFAGHQFLAVTRDEGVWKTTLVKTAKVGGAASLEILKAVASEIVMKATGLKP